MKKYAISVEELENRLLEGLQQRKLQRMAPIQPPMPPASHHLLPPQPPVQPLTFNNYPPSLYQAHPPPPQQLPIPSPHGHGQLPLPPQNMTPFQMAQHMQQYYSQQWQAMTAAAAAARHPSGPPPATNVFHPHPPQPEDS